MDGSILRLDYSSDVDANLSHLRHKDRCHMGHPEFCPNGSGYLSKMKGILTLILLLWESLLHRKELKSFRNEWGTGVPDRKTILKESEEALKKKQTK